MTLDTSTDDLIAAGLAAGKTWEQAGEAAGVSRATVARRMRNQAFRERVADYRRSAVEEALGTLTASLVSAATRLRLLIDSPNPHVAIRACAAVVEYMLRLCSHTEIEERIRRLEEQAGTGDRVEVQHG